MVKPKNVKRIRVGGSKAFEGIAKENMFKKWCERGNGLDVFKLVRLKMGLIL